MPADYLHKCGQHYLRWPAEDPQQTYATHKDVEISYDAPMHVPGEFERLVKKIDGKTCIFSVANAEAVTIVPELLRLGRAVDVSIHEPDLEDVVKIIYRNNVANGPDE